MRVQHGKHKSVVSLLLLLLLTVLSRSGNGAHGFTLNRHKQQTQLSKSAFVPRNDFSLLHSSSAKNDNESTTSSLSSEKQIDWNAVGKQFQLFKDMAVPYYQESIDGRWLLAGLLGLTLMNSGVSVLFSYLGKDFWNALSSKDATEFYTVLSRYLGALVLGAPIVTLYRYQRERLSVHWREWMTVRTFDLYTSNRVYYNLERNSGSGDSLSIDNPDQRIAEDVRSFTAYSLQLVITVLTSLIDLVAFSTILYGIYPQLFLAIILYAAAGTAITAWLGKPLVHLNFKQLQKEADLRYALVRLRDNAESIAFYGGEDLEGQAVETRVERVMNNKRDIIKAERNLEFFTTSYRYLVQILPVAVVAPKYFAGEIALGIISQSVGAFNHILSDLSIIINQFESLSTFSAGIERLGTFYQAMREVDPSRYHDQTGPLLLLHAQQSSNETSALQQGLAVETSTPHTDTLMEHKVELGMMHTVPPEVAFGKVNLHQIPFHDESSKSPILMVEKLHLCTPDKKRVLIRDLSFELAHGEHLLIVGNSGAGKSSLLRGIAGLWTTGIGSITRPVDDDVYFLPQRPYCTLGSLKDQLLYPSVEGLSNITQDSEQNKIIPKAHWLKQSLTDDELLQILEKVDLMDVARRAGDGDPRRGLQAVLDWSNMLSLGEQQRLAFGRLLVNRPRLVILDEATSALDMVAEARMYNLLKNMAQRTNGVALSSILTYISVGHRPSLLAYHDKRLRLGGESEHELADIEKSSAQIPSEIRNM